MILKGKTESVIQEYGFKSFTDSIHSLIEVRQGVVEFAAGKMAKIAPQNYKIKTPTATIGIRGSGGEIFVGEKIDGASSITSVRTFPGHVLEIQPFQGAASIVNNALFTYLVDRHGVFLRIPLPVPGVMLNKIIHLFFSGGEANFSSRKRRRPKLPLKSHKRQIMNRWQNPFRNKQKKWMNVGDLELQPKQLDLVAERSIPLQRMRELARQLKLIPEKRSGSITFHSFKLEREIPNSYKGLVERAKKISKMVNKKMTKEKG